MSFKNGRKIGGHISTVAWLIILILVINLLMFGIRMFKLRTLDLDKQSICVDDTHNWSSNYIAVSEDIGPRFLNGILGERLKLISFPEGKEYTVKNNLGLFDGFVNPVICGNTVFYDITWLDYTEDYYKFDLGESFKADFINCYIWERPFYVTEGKIYYLDTEDYDDVGMASRYLIEYSIADSTQKYLIKTYIENFTIYENLIYYVDKDGNLLKQNVNSTESKYICNIGNVSIRDMIASNRGDVYFQTEDNGLFVYEVDREKLKMIAGNGDYSEGIFLNDSSILHLKDEVLYYCDSKGNIYIIDEDGNNKIMVDTSDINFMDIKESDFMNRWQGVSWCEDYIVVRIIADSWSTGKTKEGLIAFDYNGDIVYKKSNTNYN